MPHRVVILLRAVNVGGTGRLPMEDLRHWLAELGCSNVETYIQSGNAVATLPAESPEDPADRERLFGQRLSERAGFDVPTLVLDAETWPDLLAARPFPAADPEHVHYAFRPASEPPVGWARWIEAVRHPKAPEEDCARVGDAFILHLPNGVGRARLPARLDGACERAGFGRPTMRNRRTVAALLALATG